MVGARREVVVVTEVGAEIAWKFAIAFGPTSIKSFRQASALEPMSAFQWMPKIASASGSTVPNRYSQRFFFFEIPRLRDPHGQLRAAISSILPQELRKMLEYEAVGGLGCF